jgi:hypothetical protein
MWITFIIEGAGYVRGSLIVRLNGMYLTVKPLNSLGHYNKAFTIVLATKRYECS